jgi:hypothetical protein
MGFSKTLGLFAVGALIITLFGLIWMHRSNLFNEFSSMQAVNMESQKLDNKINEPCWFRTREGLDSASFEMLKKRQDREMFGYEIDIPLSEGVRIFNEELQCSPLFRMYPPLTEEEVIGAIIAGADTGSQNEAAIVQRDILWKIAVDKKLPKSSLLYFGGGGRILDSALYPNGTIVAKGIVIYLSLGIDSVHGHKTTEPEQLFVIRKTFSGFEKIK